MRFERDFKTIQEAWDYFTQTGDVDDRVRSIVSQSWIRCAKNHLNPKTHTKVPVLKENEIERKLEINKKLLNVSRPIMLELDELVEGTGYITLLTDCDGVILEIMYDKTLKDSILAKNLVMGGIWSEEKAGTSAIALAIRFKIPIQIVGAEHFYESDHGLTCSASPIFDHHGNLLGILNMSGPKEKAYPHTLGMVVAASKAITKQLHIEEDNHRIRLANQYLNTVIESFSEGVVSIDISGKIMHINSEGAKILLTTVSEARGKNIKRLLEDETLIISEMSQGKSITDIEKVIDTKRGRIHCLLSIKLVSLDDGKVVGAVATLKGIKRIHKVINKFIGAEARFTFDDIIGKDSAFLKAIHLAQIAAKGRSTVLILGESGTGKELFAQAIHNYFDSKQPFVAINCSAIPETLIESELFGYEEGAFTGAIKHGRPGKFELANGGTIFLDEIGEMPLNTQVMLLRVLQERCVQRIGGIRTVPIDVRVIAATNKNLEEEVKKGTFRQDLYYRLNVLQIEIPPLRDRRKDIPILVEYFTDNIAARFNKVLGKVSDLTVEEMLNYHWPGNVRQLENCIERAVNLSEEGNIDEYYLTDYLQKEGCLSARPNINKKPGSVTNLQQMEKDTLIHALTMYGERKKVAEVLGISRSTLYRKLKTYGLD